MRPTVYIETSVVSYLTSKPGRDLIVTAHQELTREWWNERRIAFTLYVSELVLTEASGGDPEAAERRMGVLTGIPVLRVSPDVRELARDLVHFGPIPVRAAADAVHVAVAAAHGMDYLLTWNCRHIANAEMKAAISRRCLSRGYEPPVICTPEELMGV
jgi:predicted nucleic acid-binding protein